MTPSSLVTSTRILFCLPGEAPRVSWLRSLSMGLGTDLDWLPLSRVAKGTLRQHLDGADVVVFPLAGLREGRLTGLIRQAWRVRVAAELAGVKRIVVIGQPGGSSQNLERMAALQSIQNVFRDSSIPVVEVRDHLRPRGTFSRWVNRCPWMSRLAQRETPALFDALNLPVPAAA